MTDKEKAIVMAYTGICMLSGDKFQIFHKYVEKIMDRPFYTHEMAIKAIQDEIKEKAKADFIALCAEQEPKTWGWIDNHNNTISCDYCHTWFYKDDRYSYMRYCPNCGAYMVEPQESEEQTE